MVRLLFFLFFSLSATLLAAQVTFKKQYSAAGNDQAFFVEVLPDNSFIVAGGTSGGFGGQDAMLAKFTADGTIEWIKAYGGSNFDAFGYIHACSDGNYLALGQTNSLGAGQLDLYVVKFDINGNVLWERTCGGDNFEGMRGVCEVSDGYIITGNTASFGSGNTDIFVEKLDLSGNSVWCKSWGTAGADNGGIPMPIANGDIWVPGFINVGSNSDGILMRISASGNLISATRSGGTFNDAVVYLTSGGPGLIGSGLTATYSNNTQMQPWMLGYNASGVLQWAKRYLIPSGHYEINAEDCPDGGLIFTPTNMTTNVPEAYLVKTDGSGNITWAKNYSNIGAGRMYHARPTPDGGYVAVGYGTGVGMDLFIIKTDGSGNIEGCCPVDAPITMEIITPATASLSPGTANGPAATTPSGQDAAVDLTETDLCNGPSCCSTDAGSMLEEMLSVCINQQVTFTHHGDEDIDNDELLQFILFSDLNDTLGSIIVVSNTPVFSFDPATMQTGVTYYVAAIAGNNVGGNVDLNDPCLDISNAAELVWLPLPEVTFSVNNHDVCAGDCRTVTATFTGAAPFILTYTTPGGGPVTQVFAGNTGTFQVCPPPGAPAGSFTVQATMLVDGFCTCP